MIYSVKRLVDHNPELCQKLRSYCYELNGCCQQVHREMGPFLNEYMYQDALEIVLHERNVHDIIKEYFFSVQFHGKTIKHKHYVDFFVMNNVFIECKAVEALGAAQRQQLWNYMRLTGVPIGILWNFSPIIDQSEHYYLDTSDGTMYMF